MKKKSSDEKIDELLQELALENKYLVLIYDGEYNHYVTEILTPYGEIASAGLAETLLEAIDDAKTNHYSKNEVGLESDK